MGVDMTDVEKLLARSELLDIQYQVKRWETERIVSADQGPMHICKCGRIAIPSQWHCTGCAPH